MEFHTDGSCLGNSKSKITPGGFGIVGVEDGKVVLQRSCKLSDTTSDKAELIAFLECLKIIKDQYVEAVVYTDSQYVVNGYAAWLESWKKNGWRRRNGKPIQNKDIWKEIYSMLPALPVLSVIWERGHVGNTFNELADDLALAAAKSKV